MITHPYVTVAQWNAYLRATGDDQTEEDSTMPMLHVSAIEADAYCAWSGGRLPTDEETEGQFCPLWEWTSTTDGVHRVARGGSWDYLDSKFIRASHRNRFVPDYRYFNIGFRCVREMEVREEPNV